MKKIIDQKPNKQKELESKKKKEKRQVQLHEVREKKKKCIASWREESIRPR